MKNIEIAKRKIGIEYLLYIIAEMSANFPLGGDCRYAGMAERNDVLYISCYLSYEYANAVIYTTEVPLKTKRRSKRFV